MDKETVIKTQKVLIPKKHVLLVRPIEVKQKNLKQIILANEDQTKQIYLDDFTDHPYQAEVVFVGQGTEDFFPQSINKGDIVYIDRALRLEESVNINGEVLGRVLVGNVFMVRPILKEQKEIVN
jgi:hypothetical protein